jgi:TM2 domain-containing membrane protein YozV
VDWSQLQQLAAVGRLRPDSLVWKEGFALWMPAARINGLFGVAPPPPPPMAGIPQQSGVESNKLAAGLCGILIGGLGVHKFILGMKGPGLTMLLVTLLTCGVGAIVMHIIGLIEGIIYLTKSDAEFYQTYVVEKKEWF